MCHKASCYRLEPELVRGHPSSRRRGRGVPFIALRLLGLGVSSLRPALGLGLWNQRSRDGKTVNASNALQKKRLQSIRSHAMLLLARSFSSLMELRAFPENGDPMPQNSTEGHLSLEADVFNSARGMTFPGTRHTILPRRSDVLVPSTEPPHDA